MTARQTSPPAPHLAVVGALALDRVETPVASADGLLGGSCAYVALAASLLAPIDVISVVGDDFPPDALDPLRARGVGLHSVRRESGPSFRWGCRYHDDWETRDTLFTETGVFGRYPVAVHATTRQATHLLLTAGQTDQNKLVLDRCSRRQLTMLDTIEREVSEERDTLVAMLPRIDILTLNEYEAGILSGRPDLSALDQRRILAGLGAAALLCKQGPRGARVLDASGQAQVPAVAGIEVVDPTGAGDSFGGAALSALARGASLVDAARWGCAVASFTVEDFGTRGLLRANLDAVRGRAAGLGLTEAAWLNQALECGASA